MRHSLLGSCFLLLNWETPSILSRPNSIKSLAMFPSCAHTHMHSHTPRAGLTSSANANAQVSSFIPLAASSWPDCHQSKLLGRDAKWLAWLLNKTSRKKNTIYSKLNRDSCVSSSGQHRARTKLQVCREVAPDLSGLATGGEGQAAHVPHHRGPWNKRGSRLWHRGLTPVSQSVAVITCRGDESELVKDPWDNDVTLTRQGKCSEGLEASWGPVRAALTLPMKLRRQSRKKVT